MKLDEPQDLLDATDEAPIIRLVNSVLFQAVRQRASDIHFESFDRAGRSLSHRRRALSHSHAAKASAVEHHRASQNRGSEYCGKSGCLRTAAAIQTLEKMWTSACRCCRHRTASASCCACLKRKIDC